MHALPQPTKLQLSGMTGQYQPLGGQVLCAESFCVSAKQAIATTSNRIRLVIDTVTSFRGKDIRPAKRQMCSMQFFSLGSLTGGANPGAHASTTGKASVKRGDPTIGKSPRQ